MTFIQTSVVVLGFVLAAYTFYRNTRVRRAEWLLKVYEKFYENPSFRKIRAVLDYGGPEKEELLSGLKSGDRIAVVEEFVDYLNFFQFVGHLERMGQLSSKEVRAMFSYYIRLLAQDPLIELFCRKESFREVIQLMRKYRSERSR